MSRSKIDKERGILARQSEKEAEEMVREMEGPLWLIIGALIDRLTTDKRGRIEFTIQNISVSSRVALAVNTFNATNSFRFLRWMVTPLAKLLRINRRYFATMIQLPEEVDNTVSRLVLQRYGFDPDTQILDPNGYLANNITANSHGPEIGKAINRAMVAKIPLNRFKREFFRDFQRPSSALSLKHHFSRFSRDIFHEYDRTTQMVYAEELGLAHAIFAGTAKDNTRCFCLKRLNRIYSDDFIDRWNGMEWKGKKHGVDVREALGGFNCRHRLSWITEEVAKMLLQRRNQELNTYNKVAC